MYNDKEVAAMISSYQERGEGMTPEEFVRSIDKEEGWSFDDKQPAVFKADEEAGTEDCYLAKIGIMLPVSCSEIGIFASHDDVVDEFKRKYPWFSAFVGEEDEKIFILKQGDMSNLAYTGTGTVKEKPPKHDELRIKGDDRKEVGRYEILVKKIMYEDDTWAILTYDVTNGTVDREFNTEDALDTLIAAVSSVIRSSGDEQGKHMEATIKTLNDMFLDPDSNIVDKDDLENKND